MSSTRRRARGSTGPQTVEVPGPSTTRPNSSSPALHAVTRDDADPSVCLASFTVADVVTLAKTPCLQLVRGETSSRQFPAQAPPWLTPCPWHDAQHANVPASCHERFPACDQQSLEEHSEKLAFRSRLAAEREREDLNDDSSISFVSFTIADVVSCICSDASDVMSFLKEELHPSSMISSVICGTEEKPVKTNSSASRSHGSLVTSCSGRVCTC